jgi:hypothetical protein
MSRSYKHRTKVLGIPVQGLKDGIYPEVEMRKWQLIENIMLAATRSIRNCVFSEGAWRVRKDGDHACAVGLTVNAAKSTPGVTGVMKGIYFCSKSVHWSGLEKGRKHFLYLSISRETRLNPTAIRSYSRHRKAATKDAMLMAVVDLTGDKPALNKHPDGKIYAESMTAPGSCLHPVVVDFESGGKEGFLLETKRKISFIQVSRLYPGEWKGKMGEVAIGYHGMDDSVEKVTEAVVYNDGDTGVPLRAIIFCG